MNTVHGRPDFKARALLIGDRIDTRAWKGGEPLALHPLTVAVAATGQGRTLYVPGQ